VYELGEHDGRPFMVMEFVAGGSLAKRLKASPLPPREAAELLAHAASGAGAAHVQGIVHRDLKPDNVLLATDGTPKVTDFGIAKRQSHDLTQTNALMGTSAYMAPEQAAARAKFVGPQADVWALGIILVRVERRLELRLVLPHPRMLPNSNRVSDQFDILQTIAVLLITIRAVVVEWTVYITDSIENRPTRYLMVSFADLWKPATGHE